MKVIALLKMYALKLLKHKKPRIITGRHKHSSYCLHTDILKVKQYTQKIVQDIYEKNPTNTHTDCSKTASHPKR